VLSFLQRRNGNRVRILYLTFDDLTIPFAWSVHVREIVNGLAARGHAVRLVCPRGLAPGVKADCDPLPSGKFQHWSGSLGTFVRSGKDSAPTWSMSAASTAP